MPMTPPRWQVISESNFPWERDALDWLRHQLPDRDPWHAWTNFEFIDDEGKVNEVDLLVLAPSGLYLVEIKSRPGVVTGDTHTWTWKTDDREYTYDNPLILANRKAKRLISVLRRQPSVARARVRLPWIEPLVFLSATSLNCKLAGAAATGVCLRGRPGSADDMGIVGTLLNGVRRGAVDEPAAVDAHQARAVLRGMIDAGVRPSNKHRQVGDYRLGALIGEGELYQDWEGQHVSLESVRRRVRVYTYAAASSPEARKSLVRQAAREFQILEGIDHPGILKVRDYKESELGPALIFDHDPGAVRLDLLLKDHGARLGVDQRLGIVRQLAETLRHAHGKRLFHRALCPQSVLVHDAEASRPHVRIMNWQTASRDPGTGGTMLRTVGTIHVDDYVADPGQAYLAPESFLDDPSLGPTLDVFSLGAIAYHVFSGVPPASGALELQQRLREGPGLRISDVVDGAVQALQDLIQYSTIPDPAGRYGSIDEFLAELERVEDELTRPDPEATVDPAVATSGDRLEGGFTVVRRLGRGSSSDVLLVEADGEKEPLVLKVALDQSHGERLVAEGEVVAGLRHSNVVEWVRTLAVSGRTALLMKSAGDRTLAAILREGPRLSLDLVQRFGDELIGVVDYLEQQGVPHRDIKPDNIGISQVGTKGKLQLVLFDFSLSRTSPDNIAAGTHPYLDPFLGQRKPPRWDLQAERYALAVTLHEMITGEPPRWGDGVAAPGLTDDEVTLDPERFDPHLREGMTAFFERALRRDFRQRFDNAEEMLRAWRRVFEEGQSTAPARDAFDTIADTATAATTIAELGYTVEAQNVLETMGIHTARELLAVDRVKFRYLKGVGDRIRKEIRDRAKRLALRRPDLIGGRPTVHVGGDTVDGVQSIDELAGLLLPRRPAGDDRAEDAALALFLGLEEPDDGKDPLGVWPTVGAAAKAAGIPRPAANDALLKSRDRWLKLPVITQLRDEVDALVVAHGGVLTVPEAAQGLLVGHGSPQDDDAQRVRLSTAVVRAVIEAESAREAPRYQVFDDPVQPLLASRVELADYAKRLGRAADGIAAADPLLAPQRAMELLEAVPRPEGVAPLTAQRLPRLATAASRIAALSSRQEIYPRGMAAAQAIRQSLGALANLRGLSPDQLAQRVLGRYPQAERLPGRPVLDGLLAAAGASLQWSETGSAGPGYYPTVGGFDPSAGSTTVYVRADTVLAPPVEVGEDVAEARRFEARLQAGLRAGGFLVLTAPPRQARHAEAELLARFPLERISLDRLLLDAMRAAAQSARANWDVVLAADASPRGSRDWMNLGRLVTRAADRVRDDLIARRAPLLLVNPGLLARYELMSLVDALRDAAGRPDAPPAVWLLAPMDANALPAVDGVAVPLITSAQWARVPQPWLENRHRAGTAALTA